MKNKEKIVRDLVNTFNDRDELHVAYKEKMKDILLHCICEFMEFLDESAKNEIEIDLDKWINNFVEERFKPSDN